MIPSVELTNFYQVLHVYDFTDVNFDAQWSRDGHEYVYNRNEKKPYLVMSLTMCRSENVSKKGRGNYRLYYQLS